jgi:hypothetical protein
LQVVAFRLRPLSGILSIAGVVSSSGALLPGQRREIGRWEG